MVGRPPGVFPPASLWVPLASVAGLVSPQMASPLTQTLLGNENTAPTIKLEFQMNCNSILSLSTSHATFGTCLLFRFRQESCIIGQPWWWRLGVCGSLCPLELSREGVGGASPALRKHDEAGGDSAFLNRRRRPQVGRERGRGRRSGGSRAAAPAGSSPPRQRADGGAAGPWKKN